MEVEDKAFMNNLDGIIGEMKKDINVGKTLTGAGAEEEAKGTKRGRNDPQVNHPPAEHWASKNDPVHVMKFLPGELQQLLKDKSMQVQQQGINTWIDGRAASLDERFRVVIFQQKNLKDKFFIFCQALQEIQKNDSQY